MNQLQLQLCTYKDLPRVMPMLEAYSNIFDFHQKRYIIQQANKALDESPQGHSLFIAMHDNVIVGFIGGRRNASNPLQLDLFCIMVKRGYHGQGIGTQLFQFASQMIKEQGYKQIMTLLKSTYPPQTKDFYKRLGFKPTFNEDYTGSSIEDTALLLRLV